MTKAMFEWHVSVCGLNEGVEHEQKVFDCLAVITINTAQGLKIMPHATQT
jgi:hypothetical protein